MRFCPLYSGSSGNSLLVEEQGTFLLVDAGLAGVTIEKALASCGVSGADISGILITHEHSDHIHGAGVLSRRYGIPVYANAATWQAMEQALGSVALKNTRVFESGCDFYIKGINITPFRTPHDAAESVGYCFDSNGVKLTVMTDIGCVTEKLIDAARASDLILIESNHDVDMLKSGRYSYPLKRRILSDTGHLSNENCGKTLVKLYKTGVRNAILGHLSHENNYEPLALETVRSELRAEDIPDSEFALTVAHRDRVTGVFDIV